MTFSDKPCKNCGKKIRSEHSQKMREECGAQLYAKLKKQVTKSTIAVAVLAIFLCGTQGVGASVMVQLFDENNQPVMLNNQQDQVLYLSNNQLYTLKVSQPTSITGDVSDLMTNTDNSGTTTAIFKVPNYQSQIKIGTGQDAETFIIIPQQVTLMAGLTTNDLILVGAVIAILIVAILVWKMRRQ